MLTINEVHFGDSFERIKELDDNSVDLVVTSPPYADTVSYGNKINVLHPDNYVDWILPLFDEVFRVLKPSGSFILNINDKLVKKQRSTYVYELAFRTPKETNLQLYDTYFWYKKNGLPSGGDKRLNNRVEYLFHFVKDVDKFKCYPDRIRVPYAESTLPKYKGIYRGNKVVDESGIAQNCKPKKQSANPLGTIPTNVFRFNNNSALRTTAKYKGLHPAPYHPDLPEKFITWLTDVDDLVVDPFLGSGTTALVAQRLKRNWIGFEKNKAYEDFIRDRLKE